MWCTLRPRTSSTCSVIPADVANDDTACSASCGSNAGIAERQALRHRHVPLDERPTRQVERDVDERLVERVAPAGEPADPGLVAERLGERLADGDRHVLDRVVGVDLQVADRLHREIEAAVTTELVEHVVVERDAGRDVGDAAAVEVDRHVDRRLLRRPVALGGAAHVVLRCLLVTARVTTGRDGVGQRVEERGVLVRCADRDPQAVVEARPARAVADEHVAVDEPLPHVATRHVERGRNSTKLAPLGNTSNAELGERGADPLALG